MILILLVTGIALPLSRQSYYPVVRTTVPDGTVMTFLGRPLNFEKGCSEENDKVAAGIRKACAQCAIDLAACPRQLEPAWDAAMQGEPTEVFAVHTETQRILIGTAPEIARHTCASMAEEITRQGKQHARCIAPIRK